MAAKGRNYFAMFEDLAKYPQEAIRFLKLELEKFDPNTGVTEDNLSELHKIEHEADQKKHVLIEHLVKEFVTPIEREDILAIADSIDEMTDCIEELYQKFYMLHISALRPEALEFIDIIERCVEKVQVIFSEFQNYKRSTILQKEIIELNLLEEEGDRLYIRAVRNLFKNQTDSMEAYKWATLFEDMEHCCDVCEWTGNLVEEVIMKNS